MERRRRRRRTFDDFRKTTNAAIIHHRIAVIGAAVRTHKHDRPAARGLIAQKPHSGCHRHSDVQQVNRRATWLLLPLPQPSARAAPPLKWVKPELVLLARCGGGGGRGTTARSQTHTFGWFSLYTRRGRAEEKHRVCSLHLCMPSCVLWPASAIEAWCASHTKNCQRIDRFCGAGTPSTTRNAQNATGVEQQWQRDLIRAHTQS